MNKLWTIGSIAKATNSTVYRIEYIIRTRDIKEVSWAGNCRVFSDFDFQMIAKEVAEIVEKQANRPGASRKSGTV